MSEPGVLAAPVGIPTGGKRIDLRLLDQEMTTAGVTHLALCEAEGRIYTYDPDGALADLPPEAVPVVEAHDPPPLLIEFSETVHVGAIIRTTDAVATEIYRVPCQQHRRYRANLIIDGIDATSFASKVMEGRFAWKRITANAIMVGSGGGIAVISDLHDTAAASWAPNCLPSGTDVVFTVQGAAGRTIDWKLEGTIDVYAPAGLAV